MNLVIPIEIIFEIMGFCDAKTFLTFTLISKEFRNEINNNIKRYYPKLKAKYPYVFKQKVFNKNTFFNNCMLSYLKILVLSILKWFILIKNPQMNILK